MNTNENLNCDINRFSDIINRCNTISNKEEKEKIAKQLCEKVKNNDIIGFGSGTTSYITVCEIAKKIQKENISITAIPTSEEIKMLCTNLNIPTTSLVEKKPDWSFDGADEVAPNNWLIKGRGAAMFKEKLNIKNSKLVYILVDNSKFVNNLCEKHPIPIECFPDSVKYVEEEIIKLGATEINLRKVEGQDVPFVTENGNLILDAKFENVGSSLEKELKSIVGVIETGLFINYDNIVIMK